MADKQADQNSILNWWSSDNEQLAHTFTRQALSMVWDYCEANPFSVASGSANGLLRDIVRFPPLKEPIVECADMRVEQGSATSLSLEDGSVDLIVTDPPYYDSIPYADLSDFFYVWLKRSVGEIYPQVLRTPLTPKTHELIAYYGKGKRAIQKTPEWYEQGMRKALDEMRRVTRDDAVVCVMFAHKTTIAWETLIGGLLKAGFSVMASWPIHTERAARILAINTAALASSVTLVCRRRATNAGDGLWDDVRQELKKVANERLEFFWEQRIRGADFFISAIGPALSVFGKYERVTKLSSDEVTVGNSSTKYAASLPTTPWRRFSRPHTRRLSIRKAAFFVVWKWSYGDAKVPADESFKMAQALGIQTEEMWGRTGVLSKSSDKVQAVPTETVEQIDPPKSVITIAIPKVTGARLESAETIGKIFCCLVHFFVSQEAAAEWISEKKHDLNVLSVEDGFELGRLAFEHVLKYAERPGVV